MTFSKMGVVLSCISFRRWVQMLCLGLFLVLLFWVCWPYGTPDYAKTFQAKEIVAAEIFLMIDPLVSLSTSLAGKIWGWSLVGAGVIMIVCLFIPRGFCGYVCPLGTLIDGFDWIMDRFRKQGRNKSYRKWRHVKYFVLVVVLMTSVTGVMLAGFVAAIPLVTRGIIFLLGPVQLGVTKGWYLVPDYTFGHYLSLVLFGVVLALGVLRKRFWCNYLCPTGALFSVSNRLRIMERKVKTSCIDCNQCIDVCPFDAIHGDFTTRSDNCTFCQACSSVCPVEAIQYEPRWKQNDMKIQKKEIVQEDCLSRRGFIMGTVSSLAVSTGGTVCWASYQVDGVREAEIPVRPPGSVPEELFFQLCIRCGACFKVCPNNVLQPEGFKQGLKGLWAPEVVANWSGCEPTCNNCGQVCPTGAIRVLPMVEKRAVRMGLAMVNDKTCLPFAGREACQMCFDECEAAGYHAIEFQRVGSEIDQDGRPIEGSGYVAPIVIKVKCVGCGLCQTRCHKINVVEKQLLGKTAIEVFAGNGNEDRIVNGSYVELRQQEQRLNENEFNVPDGQGSDRYLPDFLQ